MPQVPFLHFAMKGMDSKLGFPSKGPHVHMPLPTACQVSDFRNAVFGELWGSHYGFWRSGSLRPVWTV